MRSTTFSKVIGMLAAAALALGCLVGCGETAARKPSNPSEVYQAYQSARSDNFKSEGTITLTAGVSNIQLSFDSTVKGETAGENSHLFITSKDGKSTMELYVINNGKTYQTYFKGVPVDLSGLGIDLNALLGDGWYVTEVNMDDSNIDTTQFEKSTAALLSAATFEEGDGTYIVTIPGTALAEQLSATLTEQADQDPQSAQIGAAVVEAVKTTDVKLTFDQNCQLIQATVSPFTVSVAQQTGSSTMNVDITCGFDMKFSDYGAVAEITVPDEVVATAVSTDSMS